MVFYPLEPGECLAPLPCSVWEGEAPLTKPSICAQDKASCSLTLSYFLFP